MSVGKGSIKRAAVASDTAKGKQVTAKPAAKTEVKPVAKAEAKPAAKKETATPVRSSVIASASIHEMKFEAASHIYCELPTYLL